MMLTTPTELFPELEKLRDRLGLTEEAVFLPSVPRRGSIPNHCTDDGFTKILKASPGTAARNKTLKADNVMEIEVPVPLLKRQRDFELLHDQVAQIRAARMPQLTDHSALLPSLLDRYFTPEDDYHV